MTTAQYQVIDFAVDDASTIKNKVANNSLAGALVVAAYQCYANTPAGMTVKVAAGGMLVNGALVSNSIQTSGTITAPVSNPRIDRVVIDLATGVASIVAGAEAGSPTAPAIPAGKSPVAQIALATSTTAITNALISDERPVGGGGAALPAGIVVPFAGASAPTGYLLCDGSAVSRATYANLFTAIGTIHGVGDGSTTFNLPDGRGRVVAGRDDMGGSAANRLTSGGSGITGTGLGNAGGAQTVTLSSAEMPVHSHPNTATTTATLDGSTLTGVPTGGKGGTSAQAIGGATGAVTMTNANAGSGGAHQNTQPTIIMNYIIKT